MTDWFRSWHGAPTDPKWLVVAKKAGTIPAIVSAVVWALFDHASQQTERGRVDSFDTETYAAMSGLDEELVRAIIAALQSKGIIDGPNDGGGMFLAAWEKRQPRREDNSAERTKNWRERNVTQRDAPDTEEIREEKNRKTKTRARAREGFGIEFQKPNASKRVSGIYVRLTEPTWEWFAARYRREHGKLPPNDKGGGWYFPEAWQAEAEASRQKAGTG